MEEISMTMRDQVTAQERLSGLVVTNQNNWFKQLKINYAVEASCDDCGEDIKEVYYTNKKNQVIHVSTSTNGHYYCDGSKRCGSCHDGSR
jgi:hypothetical protein